MRIPSLDQFQYFFVLDELATIGAGESFVNLLSKPFLIAHELLYSFQSERLRRPAVLLCQACELGFQVGRQV